MNTKFTILLSLVCLLVSANVQGDEIRTEKCNGQTITEKKHILKNGEAVYTYNIDAFTHKIDSIKKCKKAFSDVSEFPVWNSISLRNATGDFNKHILNCFQNNDRNVFPNEYLNSCYYLVNDNGDVVCSKIRTSKSMFDFYSPKEILTIFKNISQFKYPTPIVRFPKDAEGYEEWNTSF